MNEKNYTFKMVAPDGGWGYIILIGVTIHISIATMFRESFGLLFKELMDEIGMTSTHLGTALGIYGATCAVTSFITHHLLSIISLRKLQLIAAFIHNAGVGGCIFVNSTFSFYIYVGILQGMGLGITYTLSFTVINQYFVRRRLMATSIFQISVMLLTIAVPSYVKWFLEEYGYRGTMLLVFAISCNNFFGAALLQPVEWHMKKVIISDYEMNSLLDVNNELSIVKSTSEIELTGNENAKKTFINCRKIFDAVVDKSLQKTFLMSMASYGPSFCIFDYVTYIVMLPQVLYAANWSQDNVALALSVAMVGDLAMRLLLLIGSNVITRVGSEKAYISALILTIVAKLGTAWSRNSILRLIFIGLTGMTNCLTNMLISILLGDVVPPQKFTEAVGLVQLLSGVLTLTLGPAIGAVRDSTGSYNVIFYITSSCYAVIIIMWTIEMCYKKEKNTKINVNN